MKNYFEFEKYKTGYGTETVAGFTTFLSMAYILFVNPDVLGASGMDKGAVFTATALAAALGTLLMAFLARYPIAIAPGMGLNAFFTFTVVKVMGIPWETALLGVLISGVIFLIITLFRIREKIIEAIPIDLQHAIAAGIGLFIAFIGFQNAGLIVNSDDTLVALGDFTDPGVLLTIFGLLVTIILMVRNVKAGIFFGMAATAIVGVITGVLKTPDHIVQGVPSLAPTFGAAFGGFADVSAGNLIIVILTFLIVGFFDTAGTLVAVASQAGFMKDGKLPRAGRALLADSLAIIAGGLFGTSTPTAYIESSSGVAAGGRTGFANIVTAILFILAMFFSPLLVVVTGNVTAPALIIVGALMATSLGAIDWKRFEIAVPAFLTIATMPLTYSITTGIALGFIVYPITMVVRGKWREVHPIVYVLFVIFIIFLPYLA